MPGTVHISERYYMDVDGDSQWWTGSESYPGVTTADRTVTQTKIYNLPREANVVYFSVSYHFRGHLPSDWSPFSMIWINDPLELAGAREAPDDVLTRTPDADTPGKPHLISGSPSSGNGGKAYVDWSAATGSPTGYEALVEYSGGWRYIIALEGTDTSYTHATLREGTRRIFRVRGVTANGEGPWSEPQLFVADREDDSYPRMPKGFTAYPKSGNDVETNWHSPEDSDVTGYRVLRFNCTDECIQARDHRSFPIEGHFTALTTQRSTVATTYTDNTAYSSQYRYAVQWINNKGTQGTGDDTYSALSFIYPVEK